MENLLTPDVVAFIQSLVSLAPHVTVAAPAIAVIVDALKLSGKLPDGKAPLASAILNAGFWVAFFVLNDASDVKLTSGLGLFVLVGPYLLTLLVSLLSTARVHEWLVAIGLGKSFQADIEEAIFDKWRMNEEAKG